MARGRRRAVRHEGGTAESRRGNGGAAAKQAAGSGGGCEEGEREMWEARDDWGGRGPRADETAGARIAGDMVGEAAAERKVGTSRLDL